MSCFRSRLTKHTHTHMANSAVKFSRARNRLSIITYWTSTSCGIIGSVVPLSLSAIASHLQRINYVLLLLFIWLPGLFVMSTNNMWYFMRKITTFMLLTWSMFFIFVSGMMFVGIFDELFVTSQSLVVCAKYWYLVTFFIGAHGKVPGASFTCQFKKVFSL